MQKTYSQQCEDEWQAMPRWKRALVYLFAIAAPIICSIDSISF